MQQSLRAWRKRVKLTQMDLATQAKCQPSQISNYETGKALPSLPTALAIVGALREAGADIAALEDVRFGA